MLIGWAPICKGAEWGIDGRGRLGSRVQIRTEFSLRSPGYQTTKLHRFYVRFAVRFRVTTVLRTEYSSGCEFTSSLYLT